MNISELSRPTLEEVLGSRYYLIPRFQRPYAWDRGNIEDLWIDAIDSEVDDYFLGSLVMFPASNGALAVVDGQQRLTTALLLLCVLRDAFLADGLTDQAEGIQAFIERKDKDNKPRFVLDSESSKPYLQEHILKQGEPEIEADMGEEEEALQKAHANLTSYVADRVNAARDGATTNKQKKARVRDALARVRDRLLGIRTILIVVDDEDDAYIVFETLNTRGKELTVSDLVKNHLMRLLQQQNENVDPAREKWKQILEQFERSRAQINVNTFIHHAWLSRNEYVPEKRLFKEIKKRVDKQKAYSYLDTLVREAKLYRQISEPVTRHWRKDEHGIRDSLEALSLFGIRQPMPLLLSLYRAYVDDKISRKQLERSLWAVEAFHFTFTVIAGRSSSGGMSQLYARLARELLAAQDSQARANLISELRSRLRERRPSRDEFTEGFVGLKTSDAFTHDRRTVGYVLRRHYAHNSRNKLADVSLGTIEHLVPQSDSKLDDQIVASIGNLILVDDALNDKLANKSFALKQAILRAQEQFWVPDDVLDAREWGKRAIARRATHLAHESYDHIWNF